MYKLLSNNFMNCAKKKKYEDLWRCNNINHEKGHRLERQNLKGRQIISVQESIRNVSKYICLDRIELRVYGGDENQ